MKIYILPVDSKYFKRPKINPFCAHSDGYNIETGFYNYLIEHPDLITFDKSRANYHYLPIYWSYWQLSNDYGRSGREEMSKYVKSVVVDPERTFTVTEADWEPNFGVDMKVFSGNTTDNGWIATPLITLAHPLPKILPDKKYVSSFVGNIGKWPLRVEMKDKINMTGVKIIQSKKGEELFVNTILESYTTLCPRGSALSSYRFYESMQLGVSPIMISDYDFRPFPDKIPWNDFSYFVDSIDKLEKLLWSINLVEPTVLENRGLLAKIYWETLRNKWPEFVLEKL